MRDRDRQPEGPGHAGPQVQRLEFLEDVGQQVAHAAVPLAFKEVADLADLHGGGRDSRPGPVESACSRCRSCTVLSVPPHKIVHGHLDAISRASGKSPTWAA